jgi:hypothetical protein
MPKKVKFHKQRIIFVVKDEGIFINKYTEKSHEDWFKKMGWMDNNNEIMLNNIRGYYDGVAIYCYCGYDFREPESLLIVNNLKNIANKLGISNLDTKVYSGVIPQQIGDKWKPKKALGTLGELMQ